jgi:hypothetical protein
MLIQRRVLLPVQVQGISAEWIWEIAVEGSPNDLSGMILNLVDLDRFMGQIASEVKSFQVANADAWLKSHEPKFQSVSSRPIYGSEIALDGRQHQALLVAA